MAKPDSHDLSKIPIARLVGQLTAPQVAGIVTVIVGSLGSAFYLGTQLDPDLQALKADNANLISTLARHKIEDGNKQTMSIETFIASSHADLNPLKSMYGDRLFVPKLGTEWVPLSLGQAHGNSPPEGKANRVAGGRSVTASNDLTLLAKLTGITEESIAQVLPTTLNFNRESPPHIWTIPAATDEGSQNDVWMPYVQISLISRERAQALMASVNSDGRSLLPTVMQSARKLLEGKFSRDAMQLIDDRFNKLDNSSFMLEIFLRGAFNTEERSTLLATLGDSNTKQQATLKALGSELDASFKAHLEVPMTLIGNGMGSLSNVTPETGLLVGRLLFYVFGVSDKGRVDIEQIAIGSSGSYVRVRRSVDRKLPTGELGTSHVYDYILILSTRSDFALIHMRIPHFSERLKMADENAQAWLRQVRMREYR